MFKVRDQSYHFNLIAIYTHTWVKTQILKVKTAYLNVINSYYIEGKFQVSLEGIFCGNNGFWLIWGAILYDSESYKEIGLFLL